MSVQRSADLTNVSTSAAQTTNFRRANITGLITVNSGKESKQKATGYDNNKDSLPGINKNAG